MLILSNWARSNNWEYKFCCGNPATCTLIILIIITAFSTHFAEPQCVYNIKRPYNLSKKLYMFTAIEL